MANGDGDVQARWGLGGAVVGAVLVFVAAWLIRGLSWVIGFLVGTFLVGLHGAPSIIPSIFGVIFAAILSGGVAILLSAVADTPCCDRDLHILLPAQKSSGLQDRRLRGACRITFRMRVTVFSIRRSRPSRIVGHGEGSRRSSETVGSRA